MVSHGRADLFFGLILPHGMLELTAVFVAAGTGLRLFWAWVEPGPRTRSQALAEEGRAAFAIAVGLVGVLAVSGFIEGFVTPSGLPTGGQDRHRRAGRGGVLDLRVRPRPPGGPGGRHGRRHWPRRPGTCSRSPADTAGSQPRSRPGRSSTEDNDLHRPCTNAATKSTSWAWSSDLILLPLFTDRTRGRSTMLRFCDESLAVAGRLPGNKVGWRQHVRQRLIAVAGMTAIAGLALAGCGGSSGGSASRRSGRRRQERRDRAVGGRPRRDGRAGRGRQEGRHPQHHRGAA